MKELFKTPVSSSDFFFDRTFGRPRMTIFVLVPTLICQPASIYCVNAHICQYIKIESKQQTHLHYEFIKKTQTFLQRFIRHNYGR